MSVEKVNHKKVLFVYTDEGSESGYGIESMWTIQEGEYYIVNNIPFYAPNIAPGDVIKVEYDADDDALYFDELIEASGNSVVRIVLYQKSLLEKVGNELVKLGCDWESFGFKETDSDLIAVCIPKDVNYKEVKAYLDSNTDNWDYEEACLGFL